MDNHYHWWVCHRVDPDAVLDCVTTVARVQQQRETRQMSSRCPQRAARFGCSLVCQDLHQEAA